MVRPVKSQFQGVRESAANLGQGRGSYTSEMFQEDFKTNDIWKHFKAVENGRVFDLTYELFGMSATFRYPEALEELQPLLYPARGAAAQKTTETSALAPHVNETSSAAKKGTTEEAAYEAEK